MSSQPFTTCVGVATRWRKSGSYRAPNHKREHVAEYAKAKGLELIDVVQEAASGGVSNGEEHSWEHRPVLLRLMERAQAGEYEALIVAKLDRLSRDYATLIVLERRFQRYEVEILSVAEENGDGNVAEFIREQLALVAQLERALILERERRQGPCPARPGRRSRRAGSRWRASSHSPRLPHREGRALDRYGWDGFPNPPWIGSRS